MPGSPAGPREQMVRMTGPDAPVSSPGEREVAPPQAAAVERLHDALAEAGAEILAPFGRALAAGFGDDAEEYGHLTGAAGLLDDTDRGLVRVGGRQPRRMLNGLLSNDLSPLDEGRAVYSFVLNAKGRPVADVRAIPAGEEVWLDAPAACLAPLLEHLERFLPPLYARFELREDRHRLSLAGPLAREALSRLVGGPSPDSLAPLEVVAGDPDTGLVVVRREEAEGPGFDLYVPGESLETTWAELAASVVAAGGGPAGRRAADALRVERGIPAYGYDMGPENLAPETGQEARAISHTKGCYTGQEVVARIHYRGHVNRLLRGLAFHEPADRPFPDGLPVHHAGLPLYLEDRAVATVTTAVRSPRLGPIALAYVRREVEPGTELSLEPGGPRAATVVELPFTIE